MRREFEWLLYDLVDHPAWNAMLREALRLGMPEHYVRDFWKWDRETLEETPGAVPFYWCLRECGTHLVWKSETYNLTRVANDARYAWYMWNGKELVMLEAKL